MHSNILPQNIKKYYIIRELYTSLKKLCYSKERGLPVGVCKFHGFSRQLAKCINKMVKSHIIEVLR